MRQIRETLRANVVDPATLTCAERRQWEGYRRRKEITDAVLALARVGTSIKEIVGRLCLAMMTVRRIVRGGGTNVSRSRMSTLKPHLATCTRTVTHKGGGIWLYSTGGCKKAAQLCGFSLVAGTRNRLCRTQLGGV
jgi:hypothetical protein